MQPIVVVVVVLMTDGVQPCCFWGAGAKEKSGDPVGGDCFACGEAERVGGDGGRWAVGRRLRGFVGDATSVRGCFGVTGGICGM